LLLLLCVLGCALGEHHAVAIYSPLLSSPLTNSIQKGSCVVVFGTLLLAFVSSQGLVILLIQQCFFFVEFLLFLELLKISETTFLNEQIWVKFEESFGL
jgi:hypothetical protein